MEKTEPLSKNVLWSQGTVDATEGTIKDQEKNLEHFLENKGEPGNGYLVDFNDGNDQSDPLNWSSGYKWSITVLISMMSAVVQLATVMCAPVAPQILGEYHSDNDLYYTLLVSIWELGEVIGPLIIAPLSELYGRLPVYHVANILFIVFAVGGAMATNIHMLIAFRFLNGMSVASITLNPGIVGDLFIKQQRGRALSIMGLAPMLGPVIGPIVGSFLGSAAGWRWILWLSAILSGVFEGIFAFFYRETYRVRILEQKAKKLRKDTANQELRSKYNKGESSRHILGKSIVRPMQMLLFSPVVFLLSLYVSVVYGYLYLILTTLTEVFEDNYGFAEGPVGLTFLGLGIGMTLGIFLCRVTLDVYVQRKSASGRMTPEQRLPPVAIGGIILPAGLFMYGWTAQARVHWIAPIIATAILGFGLTATTIPASSYLVDAFGIHAASAMAANIVMRNIAGAVLPLAGPTLYKNLGLGWGNSVLGFVAIVFVPMPLVIMRYGEQLRSWEGRDIQE